VTRRPRTNLIIRWTAAILMLAVAGLLFYLGSRQNDDPAMPPVPRRPSDAAEIPTAAPVDLIWPDAVVVDRKTLPDGTVVERLEPRLEPAGGRSLAELLPMPAAAENPDAPEPADLPTPENATLLRRFAFGGDRPEQRVSVWSVRETKLDRVASFYMDAATARGFGLIDAPGPDDATVRRIVFERRGELLIVRCRKVGPDIRVVVQLRYTMPQGSD
jgi:hypothetical protein